MTPRISIVIPAHNEAGNIAALLERVRDIAMRLEGEVVVTDDGSSDETGKILAGLSADWPELRVVTHTRPLGQSAALRSAIRAARAEIVATLDGDGQNPPENLPGMFDTFLNADDSVGMIQGERRDRKDSWSKRAASRFANALRGALLKDGTRDSGCALRVFWRQAYLDLPWFRHLHRFMPALMKRDGWQILSVPVTHAPRLAGRSHYNNLQRGLAGLPDLIGVSWMIWRSPRQNQPVKWWQGKPGAMTYGRH